MRDNTDSNDISFDTDTRFTEVTQEFQSKGFDRYLINAGLVSNKTQAQYVLIVFIVIVVIASFFIITIGGGQNPIIEDLREEEIYYDGPTTPVLN